MIKCGNIKIGENMKFDVSVFFKMLFIIIYFPILMVLNSLNIGFINDNLFCFILSGIIFIIILIKDIIDMKDYIIYKISYPNKRKMNDLILYILIFSIFYLPYLLTYKLFSIDMLFSVAPMFYMVIFIFYAGFVYKLIKEYNIYGMKLFKFSGKETYDLEVIVTSLKSIPGYQKIILIDNSIILVNSSGSYEFVKFDGNGELKVINDAYYYNNKEIPNLFKTKAENKYLIIDTKIKYEGNIKLVSKNTIRTFIESSLKNNKYNNEQIDEIFRKIV